MGLQRGDLRRRMIRNASLSDLASPPQGVERRSNLARMGH